MFRTIHSTPTTHDDFRVVSITIGQPESTKETTLRNFNLLTAQVNRILGTIIARRHNAFTDRKIHEVPARQAGQFAGRVDRTESNAELCQKEQLDQGSTIHPVTSQDATTSKMAFESRNQATSICENDATPSGVHHDCTFNGATEGRHSWADMGENGFGERLIGLQRSQPANHQQTTCSGTDKRRNDQIPFGDQEILTIGLCGGVSGQEIGRREEIFRANRQESRIEQCNTPHIETHSYFETCGRKVFNSGNFRSDSDFTENSGNDLSKGKSRNTSWIGEDFERRFSGFYVEIAGYFVNLQSICSSSLSFDNTSKQKKPCFRKALSWWTMAGLNCRPLRCQRSALPLS